MGTIKPLQEQVRWRPIIGFDSEDDQKGTPVSFAFRSDDGMYYCRRRQDAINYVYSVERPSVFVAHNLEYDLNNIFKEDDWWLYEELVYASRLLAARLKGRDHLFIDSGNFFQGTLEQMGELMEVPKIKGKRQSIFSREYVERDAEIPYLFMNKFQKELNNMDLNLGITVPQLSMKAFRRHHLHTEIETCNHEYCLRSYYGGRVEIFYRGLIMEPRVCDINSSYPNVMLHNEFPDTSTVVEASLDEAEYGVGHFVVDVPADLYVPVLPVRTVEGRLFFPTGRIDGWWTYAEVRYAQSLGCRVVQQSAGIGTNDGWKPFVSFIEHFYSQRKKYKPLKRLRPHDVDAKFRDLYYKLLMNSFYGKFGQHLPSTLLSSIAYDEEHFAKQGKRLLRSDYRGGLHTYVLDGVEPAKTANYLWGAYVTSYARINLHRGLQAIHDAGGTLIYCDTDSVMFAGLDSPPLTFSDELGDWDSEQFDLGYWDQAKGYLLANRTEGQNYEIVKAAAKGIPRNYRQRFFLDGLVHFRKPIKLRESITLTTAKARRGTALQQEFRANVWRDVTKQLRSTYIKRLGEVGKTWPVPVDRIPEQEARAGTPSEHTIFEALNEAGITLVEAPRPKNPFGGEVIPGDWFDYQAEPEGDPVRVYELSASELEADYEVLAVGKVLQSSVKNGSIILCSQYMDQKAPKNWRIKIPYFFPVKSVDTVITKKYIEEHGREPEPQPAQVCP